mmetsp:Transcript_23639/g.70334  ORF Transcript_23639/g.70334 Transcript_23639/m.70334 type:complete len:300 (+) Transcript_23639:31-930(+)
MVCLRPRAVAPLRGTPRACAAAAPSSAAAVAEGLPRGADRLEGLRQAHRGPPLVHARRVAAAPQGLLGGDVEDARRHELPEVLDLDATLDGVSPVGRQGHLVFLSHQLRGGVVDVVHRPAHQAVALGARQHREGLLGAPDQADGLSHIHGEVQVALLGVAVDRVEGRQAAVVLDDHEPGAEPRLQRVPEPEVVRVDVDGEEIGLLRHAEPVEDLVDVLRCEQDPVEPDRLVLRHLVQHDAGPPVVLAQEARVALEPRAHADLDEGAPPRAPELLDQRQDLALLAVLRVLPLPVGAHGSL